MIIKKNKVEFERLAQGLLEYETLTGDEIKRVMKGEPPQVEDDEDDGADKGNTASVTAIPKTKPKPKIKRKPKDDGLEPEPSS